VVGHAYNCAGVAQLVEHQLPKLRVAGSSPVARSGGGGGAGPERRALVDGGPSVAMGRTTIRLGRLDGRDDAPWCNWQHA
jgi:hypothetical protein